MAQTITLQEYANQKSSAISEVVEYALSKGIILPKSPDFELDNSILKQIDPLLYREMKTSKSEELKEDETKIRVLGSIDLSSLNKSTRPKKSKEERRKEREEKTFSISDELAGKLRDFGKKHLNERLPGLLGKVMPHGADVLLDEVSGFLSVTDVTWEYMDNIHNFLKEGEIIEVIVLGYDEEKKKLRLGRKQLLNDPLLSIIDGLSVGEKVHGTVKKVSRKNRAYIEIQNGAIAEASIPEGYHYPEGEPISGTIININKEQHLLEVDITDQLILKPAPAHKPEQKKKQEKCIAVVLFFDSKTNHFGRVLTNSHGINDKDTTGTLHVLNMSENQWRPSQKPDEGDWIVMNPTFQKGRIVANNGVWLTFDKKGLMQALPYRGNFARIKGTDPKGNRHDYNVIHHAIQRILRNRDGKNIVFEAFAEYLASFPETQADQVIEEFLQDDELLKQLISLLPEMRLFSDDNEANSAAIKSLAESVEEAIFTRKDMSIFRTLPSDFDFIPYITQTTEILEESAKTDTVGVRQWLEGHTPIINQLLASLPTLSMELLYVLYMITQNLSVYLESDKPWDSVFNWLRGKSESAAMSFLDSFFEDRDYSFIEQSNLIHALDDDALRSIAVKFLDDSSRHMTVLRYLATHFASSDIEMLSLFIKNKIDLSHVHNQIGGFLNSMVRDNEPQIRKFLSLCRKNKISPTEIMGSADTISDEMAVVLFAETADLEYLNEIQDFDAIPEWLNSQDPVCLCSFLQACQKAFVEDEDKEAIGETLSSIDDTKFRDALKKLSEDEQYKILQLCPEGYAKDIVTRHFSSTGLFDLYMGEQWKKLRAQIPYVSFDLESDGDSIREFAFRTDENTKVYQGEEQLGTLLRALERTEIIAGHNIRRFDIGKVLAKKGFKSDAYIWDTLEIEILLNPCRYSYALHTGHTAKEDTELVDRLFWNQLYRLSQDESLCQELEELLPPKINEILRALREPIYAEFFRKDSGEDNFYQVLVDTDEQVISQLKEISETPSKALIIAPKRLWPRIAEHVSLRFIQEQDSIDHMAIDNEILGVKPLDDKFLNAILKRFVAVSRTPIIANLAQHLRIEYLRDNLLADYAVASTGDVDCADMEFILNGSLAGKYNQIYFIGCEIENRVNQYSLPTQYSPSDFWAINSSIPMRLGASSFLAISQEDRKLSIFDDVPAEAANVWIERTRLGKYIISYNYDYYKMLQGISDRSTDEISIKTIPWTTANEDTSSIVLIHSDYGRGFDAVQKRVPATSRYRATYWTYQLALLRHIHIHNDRRPIILLLDDPSEIGNVESYARKCGFYIPGPEITLARRMELIALHQDGMLVTSKESFFRIAELRMDSPYCYVWDHLAVEKHMMMWHGFADENNRSFLNDGIEESTIENSIGSTRDTYQSALLSIWPVYEYYYRFIKANSIESTMYVLDSFFDEYHSLSSTWGISSLGVRDLWDNEESFNQALAVTREFFTDESSIYRNETDIKKAMDVILATLIKTEKVPNPKWTDVQEEVLPQILMRKENYLVSLPTGGGKSVLFQGPALYNATYTNKLSIVVTPLKALMQDQVKELGEKGFITNVDYLNGDRSYQEVKSIYKKINGGEIAILYVTPERFRSRGFLNALSTRMANDNGLEYMVFDEAHCISQWGMEFRPEYLNVIKKCKEFKDSYTDGMCIAMFSATVTDMIYDQINEVVPVKRLGQDNDRKIYNPIRSHIGMDFKEISHDIPSRLKEIVQYIGNHSIDPKKSRMLVFCKTRNQCEEISLLLAEELLKCGILKESVASQSVGYFHAGMDGDDREDTYIRFKDEKDPLYILCATKAFGMGMDIPNIHYIMHLMPPGVLEDYLQEVGRAGRNEQMYRNVGFSVENPIPTVCLCSTDDIKKAKEQLLQNMLSWKNLEEIRVAMMSYISGIQSVEKTKRYPIVVPNTLWANGQFDHDFTDFKIGQYWLERMGRIKMGYLSPAHINITILDNDSVSSESQKEKLSRLSSSSKGKHASRILSELRRKQQEQSGSTVQVSIQEIAANLSMHTANLLDCLIWCEKHSFLRIEEDTRCHIAFTRLSEVSYMLGRFSHDVAFHVILNATLSLLRNNRLNEEKSYTLSDISRIVKRADNLEEIVKDVIRTDDNGQQRTEKYMIWYNENDKQKNKGLSIAQSYHDDLYKKRLRQVLLLLELIPDVKVQSYLDTKRKCVLQSVIVEKNTWKTFLPEFQSDCIRLLEYVNNQQKTKLRWSDTMLELNLEEKGFTYFESLIRFLNGMAYLATDSLLPTGIEIYTTDRSEEAIPEDISEASPDFEHKNDFDEAIEIRNLRLCVMDVLTTRIRSKQEFQELIGGYFSLRNAEDFRSLLSKYYDESDPIWDALRATAIKSEEEKLKDNPEQWAIYNENSNVNVNVEAGPGSGKTHVLTLKCAKLIYHQHVNPQSILVLAYNRAVVVELKSRLAKLFASLGLSRSASQLHVYTFHSLAKRVCGESMLEGHEMNEWEGILLNVIKNKPNEVRAAMPDLQYVFIDEFQDITQTRLNAMFVLRNIYSQLNFFTIGDKDQSIYGFEKKESMDPDYYYNQLYKELSPNKMTMSTNYRSYPKILEAASRFLPATSKPPVPCRKNKQDEPQINYVYFYNEDRDWSQDFEKFVDWLKKHNISDVAVFFRTNNEVYHGYSLIKALNLPGIRIRIQGASACELYRMREIYVVLKYLDDNRNRRIEVRNGGTEAAMKKKIMAWMNQRPNWDTFYMDFAFVLILDYLDFAASDEDSHTYGDMADSIRETLKEDNPQLYKLYDDKRFASRRIFVDDQMNVVLTTMHKVKGLEFDAVIITPSVTSLPFNPTEEIDTDEPLSDLDTQQIEEEQRLLYVAYTRARKFLFVYKGARERAVEQITRFASLEDQWGIRERRVGLDNYNIGFNANYNFSANSDIVKNVRKNDPIMIKRQIKRWNGTTFTTYNIEHNGKAIGQLAQKSTIRQRMEQENLSMLSGFFVSDIFYWTYEDSLAADQRAEKETGRNPHFASKWSEEAKKQGYIFIVNIAGYGK